MNYNIEFQIASILFISILMHVFFSKRRWPTPANFVFRVVMILTFLTLALDIVSVITITKVVAGNQKFEKINNILSKLYLIFMIAYIVSIDIYVITNTLYSKISQFHLTWKYVEGLVFVIGFIVGTIVILSTPLLYGGSGKFIYSYGTPSNVVYMISTVSVVFVLCVMFTNIGKVPVNRFIPIIAFCVIQGIIALIQMYNKELLIVGLGTAVTCLVMYFSLENPDKNMIEELNNANKRSRDLILNILPLSIANKIEYNCEPVFEEYENVSIFSASISNFSQIASQIGDIKLSKFVNSLFDEIDRMSGSYKVSKVKTAANSYIAVSGLPDKIENNCEEIIRFSLDVMRIIKAFNEKNKIDLKIKIGINNGRLVAGLFGKKRFVYDLWGEAIDMASYIKIFGKANKICISEKVKKLLGSKYDYETQEPVVIESFGKVQIFSINY